MLMLAVDVAGDVDVAVDVDVDVDIDVNVDVDQIWVNLPSENLGSGKLREFHSWNVYTSTKKNSFRVARSWK